MKSIYKIFPFVFLFITGCYSMFGPRTNVTAGFVLEAAPDSPIEKIKEILLERLRINGFYTENITMEGSGNRLEVTLDNYDSTETPLRELRKLLTSAGELEFWETYEGSELISYFISADTCLARLLAKENPPVDSPANFKDTSSVMQMLLSTPQTAAVEKSSSEHPLFFVLSPSMDQRGSIIQGPVIGWTHLKDTACVMVYLNREEVKKILPATATFRWGKTAGQDSVMSLIGLKITQRDGNAALHGQIISEARKDYNEQTIRPYISMTMNDEAAQVWTQLTSDNIGKSIAIVFDGQVFSYPTVQSQITGGVSQITGDFTSREADAMVSMLNAGMLTGSVKIVRETILLNE